MNLGDPIRPTAQSVNAGILARLFKALPESDPSNLSTFGGPSPMVGKLIRASTANNVLGIEGGFGVSTANAEQTFGAIGTMLRKQVRIDKCPWPDGQQDIRIRATLNYSQGTGGIAATSVAAPVVVNLKWNRNTTFDFDMTSNVTPDNSFQDAFGFGPGSVTVHMHLEAHGVGVGQPLVQDDGNPYTDTFVTLDVTNPVFTTPATFWFSADARHHMLPCPQWSIHHINFPGDSNGFFTAASFAHGPIGLVMTCGWIVEAVGWDTGFDDDASVGQTVDVNGDPDTPNSYEFPDVAGSPFNAGLP